MTNRVPFYAADAELAQYANNSRYAGLPEAQPTEDPSQIRTDVDTEQDIADHIAAEIERRGFIGRYEPLVPANQLGDSLSGVGTNRETWSYIVDALIYLTLTPAAAGGTVDLPFLLDQQPSSTFSGLSAPLLQLLRDVRSPRLVLMLRTAACIPSSSTVLANPSTAPAMSTAAAGGTIAAGTYTGGYTYTDAAGETQISPLEQITTTGATSTITWTIPALPPGATAARLYLSAVGTTNPLFFQGTTATTTFTLTAPPATNTAQPPTSNSTSSVLGGFFAQLVTASGDYLPLGAYSASSPQTYHNLNVAAPTGMTTLSGSQHLELVSQSVVNPVAVTFQLGLSVIAIHPHSVVKRLADYAMNK